MAAVLVDCLEKKHSQTVLMREYTSKKNKVFDVLLKPAKAL